MQSERLQHSCCSTGPLRQAWCVRNVHSQRMRHQRTIRSKALCQTWWWKEDEDVVQSERLQHSCSSTGPLRQAWCVRKMHSQRMRHQRTITFKALFQTWWWKEDEDVVQSERLQHSCCSTGPLRQAWCVRNVHSQRMRHQRTIRIKALCQTWWWKEDVVQSERLQHSCSSTGPLRQAWRTAAERR